MQSRSTHRAGTLKLAATSEFGNTRKMAEKRIFELVNSKIDDFLDIADYDWYCPLWLAFIEFQVVTNEEYPSKRISARCCSILDYGCEDSVTKSTSEYQDICVFRCS